MKLTAKQKRFCDEYLIDCNGTQAAIRAGYSKRSARAIATENLAKPYIREYIDEQLKKIENSNVADAKEVMEYLTTVMRGQSRSSVLSMCGDGMQEIIEKPPDEKEKMKAAELIGKRYGMFKDNVNLDADVGVTIIDDIPIDDD
ncbi:terminase small subunit [Massilimicrobiota timonensis]|uniref:Terminase small subunit n=1 Tax=Massilimicrobiota timonensis TaxID=1776392 RepID=A0A1Y4STJ0_9FIRM|nr:terminase small subunit [Massilimicrobiota timonensis]OUQ33239.1 terminase small subunit [Massilimicrobiota timonensis]